MQGYSDEKINKIERNYEIYMKYCGTLEVPLLNTPLTPII